MNHRFLVTYPQLGVDESLKNNLIINSIKNLQICESSWNLELRVKFVLDLITVISANSSPYLTTSRNFWDISCFCSFFPRNSVTAYNYNFHIHTHTRSFVTNLRSPLVAPLRPRYYEVAIVTVTVTLIPESIVIMGPTVFRVLTFIQS